MTYSAIALFSFLCILAADYYAFLSLIGAGGGGGTAIVVTLNFMSIAGLILLGFKFGWRENMPSNGVLAYVLFMMWGALSFLRGALNAQDYWDWKILLLTYLLSILVPLALVVGVNHKLTVKTFRFILKILFLFGFAFIPVAASVNYEIYARAMAPVVLFILFVPYLEPKWRVLIIIVAIISISMDFSYRANLLRVLMSTGLLCMYYGRHFLKKHSLNFVAAALFCLPLALLYLGGSGKFNVFTDNPLDFVVETGSDANKTKADLATDTRTFLYEEVFASMLNRHSSFVFGEGGGSAYQTYAFANAALNERGRYGSEVGFLNTLLYSGVIGVLLYATILFSAAYYAINRSNNFLCKMLALFLAGHWVLFFIEDITRLDLNFYFIWLAVGLSMSKKFRALSDTEVKLFFSSITNSASRKGYYRNPQLGRAG